MSRIYLAGKITGDSDYRRKFNAAAELLEREGHTVLNPAILPPSGLSYDDYMYISGSMLDVCDTIFLLPDWQDSPGAKFEAQRASMSGKTTVLYDDWRQGRV